MLPQNPQTYSPTSDTDCCTCDVVYGYEKMTEPNTDDAERVPGDTKRGTFIAMDKYGNKYFENLEEELPRRSQW